MSIETIKREEGRGKRGRREKEKGRSRPRGVL
jgi:hypothetical protein